MKRANRRFSSGRASRGFSLIEVMIAILILGFGLLGFALLQTMSVRFSQSANYRTQATNLSYELLDQMRGNRVLWRSYLGTYTAPATTAACKMGAATVTPDIYRAYWQCQLGAMLGTNTTAIVREEANGAVRVDVTWGDQRWNDADKDGTVSAAESNQTFTVRSQL